MPPFIAQSPGVSGVRGGGMVRTPANYALSLDSSQQSRPQSGPSSPSTLACPNMLVACLDHATANN